MKRDFPSAIEFHDKIASDWSEVYAKVGMRMRILALQTILGDQRRDGESWLDAGCGTGTLSVVLAEKGVSVECADGSMNMLSVAQSEHKLFGYPINYTHVEDVARLPYQDNSFDGVLCSSVIEYVNNPKDVLDEFKRVLKSGGKLVFSVPNRKSPIRILHKCVHKFGSYIGIDYPSYLSYSLHDFNVDQLKALLGKEFEINQRMFIGSPFWKAFLPLYKEYTQPIIFLSCTVG